MRYKSVTIKRLSVRYPFLLSLPERAIRSLSALSGGLLREVGVVVIPARLRRTALYRTAVEITLRFLIQELGQVKNVYPSEGRLAQDFLLRRGASHGIELLGLLTLHVSPIWILAALADAAGAGGALIGKISQALKDEGLLDAETRFETIDQLLNGLEKTSDHLANTLNAPPLDVAGLRCEWAKLKSELAVLPQLRLPDPRALQDMWRDLVESAKSEGRSVFAVCSVVALSTLRHVPSNMRWLSRASYIAATHTGSIVGERLLDHYRLALVEISKAGFVAYWRRQFRPYLQAAAEQFAPKKLSTTEKWMLRRS